MFKYRKWVSFVSETLIIAKFTQQSAHSRCMYEKLVYWYSEILIVCNISASHLCREYDSRTTGPGQLVPNNWALGKYVLEIIY